MSDGFRYLACENLPAEVRVFEVDPEHVEQFLTVDHEVWTLGEAHAGGLDHIPFLSSDPAERGGSLRRRWMTDA